MKKLISYKQTGIDWIGEIPESWRIKKIKHTTYVKGRIGWQGLKADEFLDEGAFLVTGTDFQKGRVNWDTCYHVTYERYEEDQFIQLREGDLLITKDGTIGKIALVTDMPDKTTLNSGIFLTRPITDDYITQFMYWVLNSRVFWNFIEYTKTGSTIAHLYQNVFETFSFPVPSIEEQHGIAKFLDFKTSQIDHLIQKKQQMIALLEEEKTAVINEAVTKGLNPDAPIKDSGVEWLGMVPEHWQIIKFRYFTDILSGFAPEYVSFVDNEGLDYFKVDELNFVDSKYRLRESKWKINPESLNSVYPSPILLIPKRGAAIGTNKIAITTKDSIFDTNVMGLKFDTSKVDLDFIAYWLKNRNLIDIADTTTIPQINNKHINPLQPALPPIEEQRELANYIVEKSARIEYAISQIEQEIKLVNEYRTALISEAVTGKIDVRDYQTEPINSQALELA